MPFVSDTAESGSRIRILLFLRITNLLARLFGKICHGANTTSLSGMPSLTSGPSRTLHREGAKNRFNPQTGVRTYVWAKEPRTTSLALSFGLLPFPAREISSRAAIRNGHTAYVILADYSGSWHSFTSRSTRTFYQLLLLHLLEIQTVPHHRL